MSRLTRSAVRNEVFGSPAELPVASLPTNGDICRYFELVRVNKKTGIEPATSEICAKVAEDVIKIWDRATVPTVSDRQVRRCVQSVREKYKAKNPKAADLDMINALFDVALCKCSDMKHCKTPKEHKVNETDKDFLQDQRTVRQLSIGAINQKATKEAQISLDRKKRIEERIERHKAASSSQQSDYVPFDDYDDNDGENNPASDDENGCDTDSDEEFFVQETAVRTKLNLALFALEADRVQVSSAKAAQLFNAALICAGVVTESNTAFLVNAKRIEREREKIREKLVARTISECQNFESLYIDSRKDATKIRDSTGRYEEAKEDHYSMITHEGKFVGHLTVPKGGPSNTQTSVSAFCNSVKY